MKKKILHIVTNVERYASVDKPTGLWLGELTHAYDEFEKQNYQQDIASPKGGRTPIDPRSLGRMVLDKSIRARQSDTTFMALLDNTPAIADVDWRDYDAIYYTGGHGVMWDFLDDAKLQEISRNIYENGGVVSSVCHGFCGLLNIRLSDGSRLINGKTITGYSWFEEIAAGVAKAVPYNAEKIAKEHGASYVKTLFPFVPYAVADGALITGQNPFSAKPAAKKVIEFLSSSSETKSHPAE
ncbi:MAG: type 1 glutamine amidotransferase domain-containing protein [Halomonas sp.]|nr:type 1 glutamine amidotransferase domain-containing protein [Halomonas sp.]MCC5902044.1 type 1 glutamine amidotransferase domain-containing protein [Halomonas sp.]